MTLTTTGPRLPLALAVLALAGCGADAPAPPAPPAARVRLFDLMGEARFEQAPADVAAGETRTTSFDFEARVPDELWLARMERRGLAYGAPIGEIADGVLRLGPGVPEDRSAAVLVVPTSGMARVRVTGRVRLEHNPLAEVASSREVLRVVERSSARHDPTRPRWERSRPAVQRVSRHIDPSGWDRFEVSFITRSETRAVELQLLHRSGGSEQAVTRFDDLAVETAELSAAEVYEHVRQSYRPSDGAEEATPWRLRVTLPSADGKRRDSVRDAVLLPPPTRLAIPVSLPPVETRPVLRFYYGMVREAHAAAGDGARLQVRFAPDAGDEVAIGEVDVDPKNDRDQRRWQRASFDLSPVAGRQGRLVFAAVDPPGEGPDELDAVVLATPRIEPRDQAPAAPNVLLIGVDTLRADRMEVFGYGRANTPHLRALGERAVRFASTRSQAPWTLPSFASILTSLYPSAHGAGRGGHDEWTPIDPTTTSLAEILARVGYETQGIVANGLISPHYGLDQGFEGYQSAWAMESAQRDVGSVTAFIEEHRSTPWFVFWHIMDPHLPYSTQARFRREFTDASYDGQFAGGRESVPFQVLDPRPGRRWYAHEGPPPAPDLSESDKRYVADYYDAEIAETDAAIGEVLEALRGSGQWDRTIVALVADHGEGLGDHDHYHHGYTLFEDQVHIPMVLRIPGAHEGRVVDRPVASIDLAPTILGALGLEPPAFFHGVDRLAADAPADDAYFLEYPTYDSSAQKGWVLGRFKYLHDPLFHTEALYDLQADPAERTDVKADHPEVVARARAEMDEFRWRELQKGRFHLRVRGAAGQRLLVRVTTNDLFDANFATRPMRPERDFAMDVDRRNLELDTQLEADDLELVFWCRGSTLRFEIALDGKAIALDVGGIGASAATPAELDRDTVPTVEGAGVAWPAAPGAVLWLEAGVSQMLPVVLSPEEIEKLQELGYTK